jgi:predicted DNA-binding protein (UPF0251 family)
MKGYDYYIMHDPLHQQRFTEQLNMFSERLDDLILHARRFAPQHIPLEVLDEIAITIGELALVLSDHLAIEHTQALARKVISQAKGLRQGVRSGALSGEQLAGAVKALIEEVHLIIHEDKRAA